MEATNRAHVTSTSTARNSSLNIAHVVDSMEMGGAEKLTAMLSRMQRDRGHNPTVHCLYLVGVLGEELRSEGFDVFLHQPGSVLKQMRTLYEHFRWSRPD